jgi:hypothetical protein
MVKFFEHMSQSGYNENDDAMMMLQTGAYDHPRV